MRIDLEIDIEEVKKSVVEKIAGDILWRHFDEDKRKEILKSINWSKMAPHIQEAIIKLAAERLFNK